MSHRGAVSTPKKRSFQAERRLAVTNAVIKAVSVPIEKACRLVLMLIAASALGVERFGSYQFAFATTTMLAVCTDLGMSVWTTRALARDRARAPAIVATALRLRLWAAGPYLAIIGIAALLVRPDGARETLALLGLAGFVNAVLDYVIAVFRGFERLGDEARVNVARAAFTLAAGLVALRLRPTPASLAAALLAGVSATAVYSGALLRRHGLELWARVRPPAGLTAAAFAEALPLWLATLLSLLYFKGDVVILKIFSTDAEIGAYSAAYKVFEGLMIVPAVVLAATFTPLARAKGDAVHQRRWESGVVLVLLALGALVGAATYLQSARIVGLVYRGGFARAIPSLRVLAGTLPILFLNFGLTHFLIARDLERRNLVFAAIMLVVNVTANLLLVPRLGGPGAAWATFITEVALTLCCLLALRERRRA